MRAVRALWIAWTLLVVAALLALNPKLFSASPLVEPASPEREPLVVIPWRVPPPVAAGSVPSMFRSDGVRSGAAESGPWTGKPRRQWRIDDFNQGIHSASKASAAADETGIYLGSDAGLFVKISWEGERLWSWRVARSQRGIHSTAALVGDLVIMGAYNGRVFALEKSTGQPAWVLPAWGAIGASPLVLAGGDVQLNVESTRTLDGFPLRLDPRTGETRWRGENLREQTHSSSAYDARRDLLVFGTNRGELWAVAGDSGRVVWKIFAGGEIKSTPVIVGDRACVTSWKAEFICVDLEDGSVIDRWELSQHSQGSAALDREGGVLYVLDGGGELAAFKPDKPEPLWRRSVAERGSLASPLFVRAGQRRLLVTACRTTHWCVLDAGDGRELFAADGGGRLTGAPVLHGGRLVLSFDFPGGIERWNFSAP